MNICNLMLFRIGHVIKICTCIVLDYGNSLHFVSFDYTVYVLHHHHHCFDFALVCKR